MSGTRVFLAGVGIISPLGDGIEATRQGLRDNRCAIAPLDLFPLLHGEPLPVGRVAGLDDSSPLPRTHRLARVAALQAMHGAASPPDAVVIGTTTGGILATEQLLREGQTDPQRYRYHSLSSVTRDIAQLVGCRGPALTVSTACSSGAAAIALALAMLRRGEVRSVLAGGADSLCRLTYFGFHSLQLVDRDGCKPLDARRRGMAVAEGAALLLLTCDPPAHPLAELLGAALSCDAYHPAAPHPQGIGALAAMQGALAMAGISPELVDYINLHGTGTPENDAAEAKAIRALFAEPPPLSSIKGATGHSLAASGAIEAVVCALAVHDDLVPASRGCEQPDPALALSPLSQPAKRHTRLVLSNSFGFGGNNGSLLLAKSGLFPELPPDQKPQPLMVHGWSCISGAGDADATLAALAAHGTATGQADDARIGAELPPRLVRRLKRLPRMALALAQAALHRAGTAHADSIFMGSGWGALSETFDFLDRLHQSGEQFPSPTDFVGSVHNGAAGQIAMLCKATGANLALCGGEHSFEQALLSAELMLGADASALVLGADECHPTLSPLFDASLAGTGTLSDGGGALLVSRQPRGALCSVSLPYFRQDAGRQTSIELLDKLGGADLLRRRRALFFVAIAPAARQLGEAQLAAFLKLAGPDIAVLRYQPLLGEFASASALAAALAVACLSDPGQAAAALPPGQRVNAEGATIVVLGLGETVTAMEFCRP